MSSLNKSPCCINCDEVLDLLDTKNGRERQFCRYTGRPECGNCARFFQQGTVECPDCRIELIEKRKCENCNRLSTDDSKCSKCGKEITVTKKCTKCKVIYDNEVVIVCVGCKLVYSVNRTCCDTCRVKLRKPSCVKEYSMYVAQINRIRNEIMANPEARINLNIIYEVLAGKYTIAEPQKILVKA